MVGYNSRISADDRKEMYGHPKELVEKLNTACLSVKFTLENIPKLVERLEQKRKLHEMCAQVMLDVKSLEKQQNLILARCKDNAEVLGDVQEGMAENLKRTQANIALLKQKK